MRLTWHDAAATAAVAASVALVGTHVANVDLPGLGSARAVTGGVLVLGVVGFAAGAVEASKLPVAYARYVALLGSFAVFAGLAGLITGYEIMTVALVAAVVAMWIAATIRRLRNPTPFATDRALRKLIESEQSANHHS